MKNYLLLFACLCCLAACNTDTTQATKASLQGTWKLETAKVDGQDRMEMLSGTVFEFDAENVTSNLLPEFGLDNQTMPYTLEDGNIKIQDKIVLNIKSLDEEKLDIAFDFQPEGTPKPFEYELGFRR